MNKIQKLETRLAGLTGRTLVGFMEEDGKSFHVVAEVEDGSGELAQVFAAAPDMLRGAERLFERLPEAAMLGAELRLAVIKAKKVGP